MCKRRGHLADGGHPLDMRQCQAAVLRVDLGAPAFGGVGERDHCAAARAIQAGGAEQPPARRSAGLRDVLDGNALLNRSGPRIVDSLELVAYLLHPAHFPEPSGSLAEGVAWSRLTPR